MKYLGWFYLHKEYGLCVTFKALISCGVSEDTLSSASRFNYKNWRIIQHPEHGKLKLIVWSKLQERYKEKIEKVIENPYEYISKQPIRDLVELDYNAANFYRQELFKMNVDRVNEFAQEYTLVASWLNMLIKMQADKWALKQRLNINFKELLHRTSEIIRSDKISLPTNQRKLEAKIKEYKEQGWECLISKKFGNKQASKIGKTEFGFDTEIEEKQIAFIRAAASKHNNFDTVQIRIAVNKIFEANGWSTVSDSTVYNILKKNRHITMPGRRGKREYNNRIAMQIKRKAPEFPLQYLTLDGWTAELLYQENGTFNNRLVVVIVLDAFNKYPLGYAIGERETTDLIRQANRNASFHIKELFGEHYQPIQLQSDRYGLKNLTPFYNSMAHLHTPAAVGNAKSKIIEPYFKYLNKNYCQYLPNWSGFNITAKKENQPNIEYLDKIKHSFPTKQGVIQQIEEALQHERKIKLQEYSAKWALVTKQEKILLSKVDLLMVFGLPTGFTNSITGQGLISTIEGQKITYDSFEPRFRALQHLKWQVIYDKEDLSHVLAISEDNKHRFVLQQKRILPMNVHGMSPEDHKYFSTTKDFNKERRQEIMKVYADDAAIVEEVMARTPLSLNDNDETTLKLMFTTNGQQKEKLQDAKGLKKIQLRQQKLIEKGHQEELKNWEQIQREYLRNKTDISKYLED